jgi:predicted aspartyl protease
MRGKTGVWLVLSIAWSSCVCAAVVTDPNQTQPDSRTEFTFARGQWPLLVPVRFEGCTYDFMLDTGCTGTMFDLAFRSELGEARRTLRASTTGKPATMQVFAAPRAFVGPFSLADCNEVVCTDLKSLASDLGRNVHGVLGMDILKRHVVRIDFDEGRIAFLDSEREDRRDWGQEVPITYNRMKLPQMKLAIGGQPEQDFVLDTGCDTSGAMAKDSFRLAVAQGRLKQVDTSMITVAGVVKSRQVRTGRVTAGPFEYQGLIFTEGSANLLGLGFLSRHVVTLDFPHDRLYLKKGESFDKPDEAGMCGVSLTRPEGRTIVSAVYKGEPAAKAGIRVGDVILKLQGQDVNTYETWEIRDVLRSGHGKEITMTIQRGGKTKDVVVVLERQI